jgi:cell division protein FtsI/penicillin-binding protein 2
MNRHFQTRCILLCSVLVIGLSLLSARLVKIQLVDRQRYAESAHKAFTRKEILPAIRGMIVDRREEPLAKSIPVSTVFVDKNHLMDPKLAAAGLAYKEASERPEWQDMDATERNRFVRQRRVLILSRDNPDLIVQNHLAYAIGILSRPLGMGKNELREKIEGSKGKWIPIVKDLPEDVADRLREAVDEHWIQGFEFENSIKRWYTAPNLATHLIGFTGEVETKDEAGKTHRNVVGRFGIESTMEEFLAGRDGSREHKRDARGLVVPGNSGSLLPPRAGLNVQLTIDMGIQAIVEEELDAALSEFKAKKGAVVMIDPKTGEILAMASRPHFDLNHKQNISETGYNYAIQAIYEPGSTIKVVAAAGALNEGLVTPQTSIFCHNGSYVSGDVRVRDDHPAGSLSFEGVLQKSNNIGTYSLGRQLGSKRFYQYVENWGFGQKTGIQLSGESSGIARDTGNAVDFSRACYGYAMNVTPLQMALAYGVIAGDGDRLRPRIVRALIANDGTIVEEFPREVAANVLKPATAKKMRSALEKVVEQGGTATRAAVPGFRIAGKTGTALKHNPKGGYIANSYIVSFVGMMPAQEPAFVCAVVIDDPRTTEVKRYGGTIAAPTFSKIASRVAARMNLQPTEPVASPPVLSATR